MGSYDHAAIEHASALHWSTTSGMQRWVAPGKFWIYEPTYQQNPDKQDRSEHDREIFSRAIFDADVITGLKLAETYFMDHDIAIWLVRSSVGRPPMRLDRHLLPTEHGFLWLDQGAPTEVGDRLSLSALQWSVDRSTDENNRWIGDGIDTLRLVPWINMAGPHSTSHVLRYGGVPLGSISWKIGSMDLIRVNEDHHGTLVEEWGHPESGIRLDALVDAKMMLDGGVLDGRRVEQMHVEALDIMGRSIEAFGTMLLFMSQRLIVSAREQMGRVARKQAERSSLTTSDVNVIKLRKKHYLKEEGQTDEHDTVAWNWRWPSAPHWRRYRNGRRLQQPIYVQGCIKGPPDKPLKPANEKLFAVVR